MISRITLGATVEGTAVDDHNVVDHCLKLLHTAGWCVGDTTFVTEASTLVWLVSGRNGENAVRANGEIQTAAWQMACDVGSPQCKPPRGRGESR